MGNQWVKINLIALLCPCQESLEYDFIILKLSLCLEIIGIIQNDSKFKIVIISSKLYNWEPNVLSGFWNYFH